MSHLVDYEIWLSTSQGDRIALLDNFISLKFVRAANSIGAFSLVIPDTINRKYIQRDQMIEIWRGVDGKSARFEMLGLVRHINIQEQGGVKVLTLSGMDGNSLLNSRIVAYASNAALAKTSTYADNAMKSIVRSNLGSTATNTARNLTSYGLAVAPDLSLGPSVTKRFAWANVLDTLNKIADMAYEEGTAVYFDMTPRIVSNSRLSWQFETYINQPGADHTYTSSNPLVFSSEWGNLTDANLTYDYNDERSVVYVGGQGEEANRRVLAVEQSARIGVSPWNRREMFYNASNQTNTNAALRQAGNAQIRKVNKRIMFSAKLHPTDTMRYGIEWKMGDKVTASFDERQFNGIISPVAITVNRSGEKIESRLEVL